MITGSGFQTSLRASRTLEDLPRELREAAAKELLAREHVLWAGQPAPGRTARTCIGVVLFGIPWTVFSVFWTVMAAGGLWSRSGDGAPLLFKILFPCWGLPFVAIGFGMLLSPWLAMWAARRTAYVLTDHRLLEISLKRGGQRKVEAFVPFAVLGLRRQEQADGSGDLIVPRPFGGMSETGNSASGALTLLGIPNVRQVEDLIQERFGASAPAAVTFPRGVGELPAHRQGAQTSLDRDSSKEAGGLQWNSAGKPDSGGSNAPWWTSARE